MNNVTIFCSNPGMVLQFTGATDGFQLSGTSDRIEGCTLDHNSVTSAGTGPLVKITAGTGAVVKNNTIQNAGNTNPTTAILYMTGGSQAQFLYNTFGGTTSDPCLYINNATGSTTISDVLVQGNFVNSFNPGANVFSCFDQRFLLGGTLAHTKRIDWEDNILYIQGSNALGFSLHGDIDGTGNALSDHNSWINNTVIGLAAFSNAYHWFGNYHNTFIGNKADDGGNGHSYLYSFGDTYYTNISNNVARNASDSGTCYTVVDLGRDVIANNVCEGVGNSGSYGFYLVSQSGVFDSITLSNNSVDIGAFFAVTNSVCYRLESNTGSFNTTDNHVIGNKCKGTGGAGQIGIQLVDTSGTFNTTFITGNSLQNLATGISIGTGTASTFLGETQYDTVTAQVADSGTGTFGVTHIVRGTCTLGTNCAVTLAQGGFSGTTTYQCQATDTTTAAATKVVNTSATVATFTGTGTDVLAYTCSGF